MPFEKALALFLIVAGIAGFCVVSVTMLINQKKRLKSDDEINEDWREQDAWHNQIIYQS